MKKLIYTTHLLIFSSSILSSQIRSGYDNIGSLPANDDSSTGEVPLGFTVNFFGEVNNTAYLNNNGNITFNNPLFTYNPSAVDFASTQIIAPFLADVDTTGAGSGILTYGSGSVGGRTAFGVNWLDVGYFVAQDDKLNSFQLILVDRSDLSPGDFDIEFNYGQIQWETGDFTGTNGFGSDSARVGYSNGDGAIDELPGSGIPGSFLDGGPNELISLTNVNDPGRYVILVRNGVITAVAPITNIEASTLRSNTSMFSSMMAKDINHRLLRARSGNRQYQKNSDVFVDPETGIHTTQGRGIDIDVFGSYDIHKMNTGEQSLPNAGGLIISQVPASELNLTTASAGIEVGLTPWLRVGGAALFGSGDFEQDNDAYSGDIDAQGFAGYASLYFEEQFKSADLYIDFLISRFDGEIDTLRQSHDVYDFTLTGQTDFTSTEYQINAGLVFEGDIIKQGPYMQYKVSDGDIDSYSETGAAGSTTSPEIDFESQKLAIGYQVVLGNGNLKPHARIAYEKEFKDDPELINTLTLAAPPSHAVILGAGLSYNPGFGIRSSIDGEYRNYSGDTDGYSIMLNLGLEF